MSLQHQPTVFVLGAGASTPYGYPTGAQLKKIIINELLRTSDLDRVLNLDARSKPFFINFAKDFQSSGCYSIDSFLQHRMDKYSSIGKEIITAILKRSEIDERLFPENDDWYSYLSNLAFPTFESVGLTPISFITFNYDRSLERYLFLSLKNKFNKSDNEVAAALSRVKIIHPHGKIGHLPWEKHDGWKQNYHNIEDPSDLEARAKMIKIIYENQDDSPELIESKQLLQQARAVYFIGFGFHEDNLRRLGLQNIWLHVKLFASGHGMTKNEYARINRILNRNIEFHDSKALQFCRDVL